MAEPQPTYRFKWNNWGLSEWRDNVRARAANLRRQALHLTLQADQIDEELRELESHLVEVPASTPKEVV